MNKGTSALYDNERRGYYEYDAASDGLVVKAKGDSGEEMVLREVSVKATSNVHSVQRSEQPSAVHSIIAGTLVFRAFAGIIKQIGDNWPI